MSYELTDQWIKATIVRYEDGIEEIYPLFAHTSVCEFDDLIKDLCLFENEGIYEENRGYDVGQGIDFIATVTRWNEGQSSFPGYIDFPAYYEFDFKIIPSDHFKELRDMNKNG